jgi:hypothetical protein
MKGRDYLGDQGLDGKITLKLILGVGFEWIRFICLRLERLSTGEPM